MVTLVIKSLETDEEIRRIPVHHDSERMIEKVEDGLYARMDLDKFYLTREKN
jgi:hypothetical protein